MCVRLISVSLLVFCGMTAFLSFKILSPNVNGQDEVYILDEKIVTLSMEAATKGDTYQLGGNSQTMSKTFFAFLTPLTLLLI